jgi:hypothetical protein
MEIREPDPLPREAVEVRRREIPGPIYADIGVTEVIGQDDDDIRRPFHRHGGAAHGERHEEQDEDTGD